MTSMTHTTNWTEKHLLDEVEELSIEAKKLKEENETLKKVVQLANADKRIDAIMSISSEIESGLKAKINKLQKENTSVKKHNEELRELLEDIRNEVNELELTVCNLEKEIDDMADNECDLREIIRELEEELKEEKQNNDPNTKEELFKDKLQDALDSFQYEANAHVKELKRLIEAP